MKTINKDYPYYSNHTINNLYDLLRYQKDNNPIKVAFSYRKDNILIKKTYQNVYDDVENLSGYFSSYKNKNIGLIGENSYEWLIAFLAITLSSNVCVVFDKDISVEDLEKQLKAIDIKELIYSEKYLPHIKNFKNKHSSLESLNDYQNSDYKFPKADAKKTAVIFFTSGTTGANKAVMLSQESIASDINGACSLYKPAGGVVSILPYHHAFGLITSIFMAYNYGEEVFINSSLKYMMRDFKEQKPDTLFVVPLFIETFYKQIWKNAKVKKKKTLLKLLIWLSNFFLLLKIDMRKHLFKSILNQFGGNVSHIICGGAYLDPKYIKWFRSIGLEILNGYGITECSPVIAVNRNHFHKDGSVGIPCKGVEVKIINDEICVKSDINMLGYYKDEDATKEVIKKGYFHTGDLGYIDEDGFIFITGRKKNIIILSNGENISPEVIESEFLKDKAVSEVIVYEKDNHLVAAIYPQEEYLTNYKYFDDLLNKYNKNKAINHQVKEIKIRDKEFIKNNNKKIIRKKAMED